jgi:anti-repressor protein
MNNQLQIFNFNSKEVRTILINNEPWWIAKDICDILELTDVSMSLNRLEDDEKLIQKLFVSGQNRDIAVINESGLYSLILRSNKPDAKIFKKWITSEVLPSIRKTGQYNISNPQALIATALIEAAKLLEEQRPKVEIYDTFMSNKSSQKIGDVAKLFGIKPNTLHQMLRDSKIMQENYTPYAQYQHLFKTVETPTPAGFNRFTSYFLPEGIAFIAKKFKLIEIPENHIAQIN